MMEDVTPATDEEKEAFPDLSVITIVLDGQKPAKVDLGNVTPHAAITILGSVADTLSDMIHPPVIRYNGAVLVDYGYQDKYDSFVFMDDDDDDLPFDWNDDD